MTDGTPPKRDGDRKVPQVVIVGGGFAGIYAVQALKRAPVRVTIIDRRNYHLFQPMLYQVATAGLNPSDITHRFGRSFGTSETPRSSWARSVQWTRRIARSS
jgi:NADH dehydrogenase FAD-containing subunit